MMMLRTTYPNTGPHTLCEPAQSTGPGPPPEAMRVQLWVRGLVEGPCPAGVRHRVRNAKYFGILSGIRSDSLPGIQSGIYSDILSGTLSLSDILSDIYSCILCGILYGLLSDHVSGILRGILSGTGTTTWLNYEFM